MTPQANTLFSLALFVTLAALSRWLHRGEHNQQQPVACEEERETVETR